MTDLSSIFTRHEKVILELSAGKDSAAVLWLLEPYWHKLQVIWANPGNPYPETVEYMEKLSAMLPNFVTILGDQPNDINRHGWPVDIIPTETLPMGMMILNEKRPVLRPYWDCCFANMWKPMGDYVKDFGATAVIRGQKRADKMKNTMRSGEVVDGVEYIYPIDDYTDAEVFEYLAEKVPDSYERGLKSSLDCMNCTAYTAENPGRIADLATIDEQAYKEVTAVHYYLLNRIESHMTAIRSCHAE